MKLKKLGIILLLVLFLLPLTAVQALETKAGGSIYIAEGEIVTGNLLATGKTITIDGTISGDLIVAAQNINVNGRIDGDIIALVAQNINVNGEVGGNVRVAGNSIILNGSVARNVNAVGTNIVFGNNAKIGWDALLIGSNAEIRGIINGSLTGQLEQALISGKIGKNLHLKMSKNLSDRTLVIAPETIINGDVTYTSDHEARISEQASISGAIKQNLPNNTDKNWFLGWIWKKIFAIFSALVVGLLLVFLMKKITPKVLSEIKNSPSKTILPGLIAMCIVPPIALILAFTIIGIPLAIILLVVWAILIYLAQILTAILVGELLIKKISKKESVSLFGSLVLGVFVCWLLFAIPFVGWILSLLAVWFGLGGIWLYASNQSKNI